MLLCSKILYIQPQQKILYNILPHWSLQKPISIHSFLTTSYTPNLLCTWRLTEDAFPGSKLTPTFLSFWIGFFFGFPWGGWRSKDINTRKIKTGLKISRRYESIESSLQSTESALCKQLRTCSICPKLYILTRTWQKMLHSQLWWTQVAWRSQTNQDDMERHTKKTQN